MNDLWKWEDMLDQGETFALIPNMMYVSREEGTQANTHQGKPKTQAYVSATSGTVVPMCTGRPCQIAAWP